MGSCISNDNGNSKLELSDINSNIYRVTNVDDNGVALWSGQLGITRAELTLYRKGRDPTKWPLKCLRRYGYDADLFSFEAGRRCTTGEGIYAFRCRRAESLFQTLQSYIQQSFIDDGNVSVNATSDSSAPLAANGPSAISTSISSNYILPNSRSANQVLRTSPSVCSDGTNRSLDALAAPTTNSPDGNYLEPLLTSRSTTLPQFNAVGSTSHRDSLSGTASGPLSPGGNVDPHSPGSPNSINNILEVTSLNPLPSGNYKIIGAGVSNIYQEFPLRESNSNHNRENGRKKLSLDIPPQELAPSVNCSSASSGPFRFTSTMNSNISTINHSYSNNVQTISNETSSSSQTVSPTQSATNDAIDSSHMYMNVTPGEINTSITKFHYVNSAEQVTQAIRNNTSTASYNLESNHCYENLEPNEIRPLLLRTQIQQTQSRRLSKAENIARQEQMASTPTSPVSDKNSEPNTPTFQFNYIVLDLDQSHTPVNPPSQVGNVSTSTTSNTNSISTTSSSTSSTTQSTTSHNQILNNATSLLPPESPKKGIFDYATIDFNKTVALSNSITPSMDCEGSRKTRHSSTTVPSSLSHSTSATNTTAPPSHSNSISD